MFLTSVSTHSLKLYLWKCFLWGITLSLSICWMSFGRIIVLDRCLLTNMAKKAFVRGRGIRFFSPHDMHRQFTVVIGLSDTNQLRLRTVLTCLFTDSLIFFLTFALWPLPTSLLWLLYHNLTPTTIKGWDIESVDGSCGGWDVNRTCFETNTKADLW